MIPFHSTLWTVIEGARAGEETQRNEFILRYRAPVVSFIVRRGLAGESEDLAQEVFIRIFTQDVLEKADPSKGRFRSLLLAVTRHVIGTHLQKQGAQKRGGGQVVALGEIDVAAEGEEDFDREWVAHLLEVALARLGREHPSYHETLGRFLFEKQSYDEIAGTLEKTVSQVRNHIHRGRTKLVQYLREEVRQYSISEEDYQEELRALSLYFPEEKKTG